MVVISKATKIAVYSYLFKEGVMVAKKSRDHRINHDEVEVPNLEVLMLMKSLTSREFVKQTFNWQWYYWYLTDEGVEYLREYLHLPAEIVPATLKKAAGGGGGEGAYERAAGGFGRGGGSAE